MIDNAIEGRGPRGFRELLLLVGRRRFLVCHDGAVGPRGPNDGQWLLGRANLGHEFTRRRFVVLDALFAPVLGTMAPHNMGRV